MPRSGNRNQNAPNRPVDNNILSLITPPDDLDNLSTPPSEGIHPNITVRDTRNRIGPMTPEGPPPNYPWLHNDNDYFNNIIDSQHEDPYGINASVPVSYERYEKYNIEGLSNKTLDAHANKLKIKKTNTVFDDIMMEYTNIHDYIKQDINNIVFIYEKKYYLSTKTTLKSVINMTTTDNAIVFDCRGIGYRNVNFDYPYVLINKIGIILNDFTNVISLENAIAITKPESGQYFYIKGTDDVLISTVTDNVLNGKYPNALGASHCQGGKSAIVYDIQTFKPEYTSPSKSPKTHKKRDSKSSKSPKSPRKSVKRSVKRHTKRMLK